VSLTVTDQFCGAGGSSIGAETVDGVELRLAMNHWRRAIETHETNFPHADHDCADISNTDPRRYPHTDILLTSPECTNHSLAKGSSRKKTAPHLFETNKELLARIEAERSRATMFDVPRFAEYHDYQAIVVENVVDARDWLLFPAWWQAMELLGYQGTSVYLNSMFFPPTPQSRDRMYVVWTKKGLSKPDLDFRPLALCVNCEEIVHAIQSWKRPERPWGRYRQQYVYRCPACAEKVDPAYTPALTAIDWSDLGQRIGDREKPLAPATIARIRAGLERYGRTPAAVQVNGNRFERRPENAIRYKPVDGPLRTQTGSERDALFVPFVAELRGGSSDASSVADALATIVASGNHHALVVPPAFIVRNNQGGAEMVTPVGEEMRTLTTKGHQSLLVPPDAYVMLNNNPRGNPGLMLSRVDEAFRTFTASGQQSLIVPLANVAQPTPTTDPMGTLHTRDRFALVVPTERGSDGDRKRARDVVEQLPTQTSRQTLGFASVTSADIEDCGFRMLQPPEIGAGMAFPSTYIVTGNKREQVKQYGNAVTPPVMSWLVGRVAEALSA
jgi:DNA (cytosine-5)-methyltransferase 1